MGIGAIFQRKARPVNRSLVIRPIRKRAFSAAKTDRLTSGWTTTSENINQALFDSLGILRARARDAYLNNDTVRRFVGMTRSNVVGDKGVILQGRALNLDGSLDAQANEALESAWRDWGRAENCDAAGRLTWVGLQHQAITAQATDGEILARHIRGLPAGGPYGYRLQHLDPEALDHRLNQDVKGGGYIRLGVEFDTMGRPVAYHFKQFRDSAMSYWGANGTKYVRIPAADIIHAYAQDHVGQLRGYPSMATSLGRLKMLDGYFEAALTAARAGASKMGFLRQTAGGSYTGDDIDAAGNQVTDFEAGTIERLNEGEEFIGFDPAYPHQQFAPFVKTCLQTVAASLGVSYHGLSGDLEGVNFSSIRSGVLEERESWKAAQGWFVDAYCIPVFQAWLPMAIAAGKIQVMGKSGRPATIKAGAEEKFRRVAWQPRRWSWVDPQREMTAALDGVKNNATTLSAIIREQGRDPIDVFTERAAEMKLLESLGLTTEVAAGAPAAADPEPVTAGKETNGDDE